MLGEETVRGGVCPRAHLRLIDSEEFCVSEEDRSSGAGLLENSLRNAFPTLEDRLGRVSSLSKQDELFGVGFRTIPENGTADNLSLPGGDLVDRSFRAERSVDTWATFGADSILGSE